MPKSNYLRDALLDALLGTGTFPTPATVYVALYTTDPTAADTGTEVTGGGYARVATDTDGVDWTAADIDTWDNAVEIAFPESTGQFSSGASIPYFGIRDAPTGGNLLYFAALNTPRTVSAAGVTLRFAAGTLTVSES